MPAITHPKYTLLPSINTMILSSFSFFLSTIKLHKNALNKSLEKDMKTQGCGANLGDI